MMEPSLIKPPNCYWARRKTQEGEAPEFEIVQVSDVFGAAPDYWSVAVLGSDQHRSLGEFDFIMKITAPEEAERT
jgi:hypothetical protein